MAGHSGQTSMQIAILTKPPQSYMAIPPGESDHLESGRFEDQAERLFSRGRAKSTYFLNRKKLEKHVTASKRLTYRSVVSSVCRATQQLLSRAPCCAVAGNPKDRPGRKVRRRAVRRIAHS